MRQFDPSERYRCVAERFEAQHGSAAAFDRAMILFIDVVRSGQLLTRTYFHFGSSRRRSRSAW
jgi:hypothetical protein